MPDLRAHGAFHKELLPPPGTFYRQEFARLGRPSRGWSLARCCFHKDTNPSLSVNLESGGFFCFGCGARGGDVVDFLMRRDGLSFKAAALALGAMSDSTSGEVRRLQRERASRRDERESRIAAERARRLEARDWLHCLERIYNSANSRLSALRKGAREKFAGETETCWALMADALPQIRDAEAEYGRAAGL